MEPLPASATMGGRPEIVKKIIVLGGRAVGKTSFLRRLLGKPLAGLGYVPTVGIDVVALRYSQLLGERGQDSGPPVYLHFWDAAHTELSASPSHHALLFGQVAGVFLVLDVGSRESLEAVDAWQRLLARYVPGSVPRVLLAHKADLFSSHPAQCVVSDRLLEAYKRDAGLTDWCYTVGHEYFGDYVATRSAKSKPVADAVQLLVERIFRPQTTTATAIANTSGGRASSLLTAALASSSSTTGPGGDQEDGGALASSLARLQQRLSLRTRLHGEEEVEGDAAAAGVPLPAPGPDAAPSAVHAMRHLHGGGWRGQVQRKGGRRPVVPAWHCDLDGMVDEEEAAVVAYSYQPLQGWLGSVDLEVLWDQGPAIPMSCQQQRRQRRAQPKRPQLADAAVGKDGVVEEEDAGWRHLAGSMGRTEAERLLRTRPTGAFLLRRVDERALRLSYRTQYGVEHAPLIFTPDIGWSVVRQPAPSQQPGLVPDSPMGFGRPLQQQGQGQGGQAPPPSSSLPPPAQAPQSFKTLAELLRFFARKASHGLVFRRVPGSVEYEVVEDDKQHEQQQGAGGGGVLGWLHRRVQSSSFVPATSQHQQQQRQQEQQQQQPSPKPPRREEVVCFYRELRAVLLAAVSFDEAKEEDEREQGVSGRGGLKKVTTLLREREGRKRRERGLLDLCNRSCGEAVAAVEQVMEEKGAGGGRGGTRVESPLPFLLDGPHDADSHSKDPGDAAALLQRLDAVDARVLELVSALNAALLARLEDKEAAEAMAGEDSPFVLALRAVAGWRPFLQTLRLRIEVVAAAATGGPL